MVCKRIKPSIPCRAQIRPCDLKRLRSGIPRQVQHQRARVTLQVPESKPGIIHREHALQRVRHDPQPAVEQLRAMRVVLEVPGHIPRHVPTLHLAVHRDRHQAPFWVARVNGLLIPPVQACVGLCGAAELDSCPLGVVHLYGAQQADVLHDCRGQRGLDV